MTTIEEIKRLSEAGSIDDPDKAEAIANTFANLKMGTVFDCCDPNIKLLFYDMAAMYSFHPAVIDNLSYIELMTMIDRLDEVVEPGPTTPEQLKRLYIHFLKRVLIKAGEIHPDVKCFLAIRLDALRTCLNDRRTNKLVIGWFDSMQRDYCHMLDAAEEAGGSFDNEEDSLRDLMELTVAHVLDVTTKVRSRSWNGWRDIDAYKSMIDRSFDVDKKLLKNMFLTAYRKEIGDLDICTKYFRFFNPGCPDEDEIEWDDADFDDLEE